MQELHRQQCDECCPNLRLQRVGGGPHEGLDAEILLQRLEQQLDLPALLVDGRHDGRCQFQMIRQKYQFPLIGFVPVTDAPQERRRFRSRLFSNTMISSAHTPSPWAGRRSTTM